jgi:hypothetical protein
MTAPALLFCVPGGADIFRKSQNPGGFLALGGFLRRISGSRPAFLVPAGPRRQGRPAAGAGAGQEAAQHAGRGIWAAHSSAVVWEENSADTGQEEAVHNFPAALCRRRTKGSTKLLPYELSRVAPYIDSV